MNQVLLRSSSKNYQGIFSAAIALGLLVLLVSYRTSDTANGKSALYLGMILCAVGLFGLLSRSESEVSRTRQTVVVLHRTRFSVRRSQFPLADLNSVETKALGRANAPKTFQIYLVLNDGRRISTGFWGWHQDEIDREARGLAKNLGAEFGSGPVQLIMNEEIRPFGMNSKLYLFSSIIAVFGYAIYYRFTIGPWCPAMWFGTAPLVIMSSLFFASFQILRRLMFLR